MPSDTLATFVDAVVVTDRSYAYQSLYITTHFEAHDGDWDAALTTAIRLRKYAHTAADREGEKRAALLTAFAFIALQRYREVGQSLSMMYGGEMEPLDLWHGALARTAAGIAAYAQGETDDAVAKMQDALDCLDRLVDWTTQDRLYHGQCSPSRKAAQRLACDADHIRLRETLRVALREVIGRLAVMEGRGTDGVTETARSH